MGSHRDNGRTLGHYDYVVVGSGFAALAFIDETLRLRPRSRILCIERGHGDRERHLHELLERPRSLHGSGSSLPDVVPDEEPWAAMRTDVVDERKVECAGMAYLAGGRSNYWYGWCMQPTLEQMRAFPSPMVDYAAQDDFWRRALDLLNVYRIDCIPNICNKHLQKTIDSKLCKISRTSSTVTKIQPAYFSQGSDRKHGLTRYEVASRLKELEATGSLEVLMNHTVTKLTRSNGSFGITLLHTDKTELRMHVPETKVILCAGAIPNATLLLNSCPHLGDRMGRNISGHFRSHIAARIPASALLQVVNSSGGQDGLEMAAHVICGRDEKTKRQYHIQLSAFRCPFHSGRYADVVSQLPRYGTVPMEEHLQQLGDDILLSCATLGELSEGNEESSLRLRDSDDPPSNVELQFTLNDDDLRLWDLMDEAAFDVVEALAGSSDLRYWNESNHSWTHERPGAGERRSHLLVHEAGFTPMGETVEMGVLDEHFRVHGCDNLYVTGSGIFPTAGSWNPTLTVCAFAQELARILAGEEKGS